MDWMSLECFNVVRVRVCVGGCARVDLFGCVSVIERERELDGMDTKWRY